MQVLDHGQVELLDHMGSDLTVVNAARQSFDASSKELGERDVKLIVYLMKNRHRSPFYHPQLSFKIKAPVFVLRQWMRHVVGCAWSEQSARYCNMSEVDFFHPFTFWSQSLVNKQGSDGPLPRGRNARAGAALRQAYNAARLAYSDMIDLGVSKEQARLALPVGMYSNAVWTCSLYALFNFLDQRLDSHAQAEMQQYARAVYDLAQPLFPACFQAFEEFGV
jgi:thymidylate synthase (FAD)